MNRIQLSASHFDPLTNNSVGAIGVGPDASSSLMTLPIHGVVFNVGGKKYLSLVTFTSFEAAHEGERTGQEIGRRSNRARRLVEGH